MAFKVDKQTVSDLKIYGDPRGNDVYGLFNKTRTKGGSKILKEMFIYPLSHSEEISNRVKTIRYFREMDLDFPFKNEIFDSIEFYLGNIDQRTMLFPHEDDIKRKLERFIGADSSYQQIHKEVINTLHFLVDMRKFLSTLNLEKTGSGFRKNMENAQMLLNIPHLAFLNQIKIPRKLSFSQTAEYDKLFRFTINKKIARLLYYAYLIDTFIAVAKVAKTMDLAFAEINTGDSNAINFKGVYHPLVPNAISNDMTIDEDNNMIFLTGANMAGKSTFMKTIGISLYLAHVGFPVPAKKMQFSIQKGMFTTINLADDLDMGFSHFYAEVSRLKKVAESVNKNKRLVIIFDELFRGTNVKDAFDATVAVVNAFAKKRKCTFIISTHLIEAASVVGKKNDNINFIYLPTLMEGNSPRYTYRITQGITNDRHGMLIIENEKILDILKK